VSAAKSALLKLENELRDAYGAVAAAQTEADATLPQCRMVRVHCRTGKEEGNARYVIERRTPAGRLVVRQVGNTSNATSTFVWDERANVYRLKSKDRWSMDVIELRDVPPQYAA
jgi:hypothetical protein